MNFNEEALLLLLLERRRQKKRKKRKFWVHPIVEDRVKFGQYQTLYHKLRNYPDKFFQFLRMSVNSFDELLHTIGPIISKSNTIMRRSISSEERLVMCIRYLGSGCTFMELHFAFRCGVSTATGIVKQTCQVIWNELQSTIIPTPNKDAWIKISDGFKKHSYFPNCIGAIDGKHIRIIKPAESGSLFFNYKKYFSITLLAVTDSEYNFVYVDIGSYGRSSDSTVFSNSRLFQKMQNNELDIPNGKPLANNGKTVPFVLIGDEGFALSNNLLRPYARKNLSEKKKVFNYRLSSTRRSVECSFGILANKWRVFHRPLNVSVDFAVDIVKACCILHNFVRQRDGYNYDDTLTCDGLYDLAVCNVRSNRSVNTTREEFSEFFMSAEGQVPWQWGRI